MSEQKTVGGNMTTKTNEISEVESLVKALETIAGIAMDDGRISVNHIGQALTQRCLDSSMAVTRGYFLEIHGIATTAINKAKGLA